jgi:hypothetical protein
MVAAAVVEEAAAVVSAVVATVVMLSVVEGVRAVAACESWMAPLPRGMGVGGWLPPLPPARPNADRQTDYSRLVRLACYATRM